jgi:hypothetical protein
MRSTIVSLAVVGLVACGPSSNEVKTSKEAHYNGDKLVLFQAARTATEAKYKLAKVDETTLGLQTVGRWYNPEGQIASERGDDMRDVPDKSINITLVVTLLPDGESWVVAVKPVMMRYFQGRPNPDKLEPNDPSVPGWATGKVDNLSVEIHEALKQYEVKSVAGAMPPPAAPPSSAKAPDEPPPAQANPAPAAPPAP